MSECHQGAKRGCGHLCAQIEIKTGSQDVVCKALPKGSSHLPIRAYLRMWAVMLPPGPTVPQGRSLLTD
jgi:hypothetical protein